MSVSKVSIQVIFSLGHKVALGAVIFGHQLLVFLSPMDFKMMNRHTFGFTSLDRTGKLGIKIHSNWSLLCLLVLSMD